MSETSGQARQAAELNVATSDARLAHQMLTIAQSRLFDHDFYRREYWHKLDARADPIKHYLVEGAKQGFDPNPMFSTAYFRNKYDLSSDDNPLLVYITRSRIEDLDPHVLFDAKWYRETYLNGVGENYVCLRHYLFDGRFQRCNPNPFFDGSYYLDAYPDVAASGMDPFVHYCAFGEKEGRWPSPGFDPDRVRSVALNEEQVASARDSLLAFALMCRESLPRVDRLYRSDDAQWVEDQVRRAIDCSLPTVAIVAPRLGGGVTRHIEDLVRSYHGRANVLQLICRGGSIFVESRGRDPGLAVAFPALTHAREAAALVRRCGATKLHIQHGSGIDVIQALVRASGLPFEFTMHDYHVLSPQPHLVDSEGHFVGDDLELKADVLVSGPWAPRPVSLRSWQREHRWLLEGAEAIVVPSRDVQRRLTRRYPHLEVIVRPFEAVESLSAAAHPVKSAGGIRRIALLGTLSEHKGRKVVLHTVRLARDRGLQIEFVLIGDTENRSELIELGLRVTGAYDDQDLNRLITSVAPDVIWFPAQCPETYSYTLSAGLRSGVPLITSNLGSFPERTAARPDCRTVPWDAEPSQWLAELNPMAE